MKPVFAGDSQPVAFPGNEGPKQHILNCGRAESILVENVGHRQRLPRVGVGAEMVLESSGDSAIWVLI